MSGERRDLGALHEVVQTACSLYLRLQKFSLPEKDEILALMLALHRIEVGREARAAQAQQAANWRYPEVKDE